MGITDAAISVDGENIPILDGSAGPIVAAMQEATIVSDGAKPQVLTIEEPILVQDEKDQSVQIEIRPRTAAGCRFRYDFFTQRPVPQADGTFRTIEQSCIWEGDVFTFSREIAAARTFSFKVEAEAFAKAGLFTHFTPKDLLVVDDISGQAVQNSYRYKNELARHKLLDLIGDLALVGRRLQVDISASKTGHALNHRAAQALAALLPK
jgi:UDP-3-O-acyl-N-acetylglucosamine deacetylase